MKLIPFAWIVDYGSWIDPQLYLTRHSAKLIACTKLRRLGLLNRIVADSDSKQSKLERQFQSNSKSDDKIVWYWIVLIFFQLKSIYFSLKLIYFLLKD